MTTSSHSRSISTRDGFNQAMPCFNLIVCLVAVSAYTVSAATPIEPKEYVKIIKQGFSTNYFKTLPAGKKYNDNNIKDVYEKGFRNLRLRCEAGLYEPPYNNDKFDHFLTELSKVVEKCIQVGVNPIISWINHEAEAQATEQQRLNYIEWWTKVANKLKDQPYSLGFNLFTELGVDKCKDDCAESLRENTAKYNRWTSDVIDAIRATGGNNDKRILILASPKKTAKGLALIDKKILEDKYLVAEWHLYASGPNKIKGSAKYWSGNGVGVGRTNVKNAIQPALDFTKLTNVPTYLGAWMAEDGTNGKLTQQEVFKFSTFFVTQLKENGIPWSLNVLDRYYDTKDATWINGKTTIAGQDLYMGKILKAIIKKM